MPADSFIDTNLFIYQLDTSDERKNSIADQIIRRAIKSRDACISFQVVQECLNTLVRKAEAPLPPADAKRYLETVLLPLWTIMPDPGLYQQALDLQSRYHYGFSDSLIIAASLWAGCRTLYSEDLHNGQRIGKLTIRNPFLEN